MSEPVTALDGAIFDGLVTVADGGPRGMITLRGDLASAPVKKAVKAAVGLDVPGQRQALGDGDKAVLWMSPDELMILCPRADSADTVAALTKALGKAHSLVADVSDARAVFRLRGAAVREVLAKLAPVDMAPDRFAVGTVRRTRLAQVAGAFWLSDSETATVICFRSVSRYMFDLLSTAAQPDSTVGFF
ncbi:sarcosine oxidase subunit gamma [Thalassococcus sp. CAU 1522]|uniref:Sarcosine oxidase subunit gamma n=1 Tax=Thalassococcus arenae TaxID=2851652 RepID=A0ABS6NBK2_9RHOB|nr:sarcosine oxidase subunit gamma family protein [Thalassococcus arenae]MBV2361406.1 sarcosine oxidase subunit gamma [Thalassococcus arenae]